jgi:hypothetical protein
VRRLPRQVEQLSGVTDELLLRAPVQELPVGFESRVVGALGLQERKPRRARRPLRVLGPPVAAALAAVVALVAVYHDDRVRPSATARRSSRPAAGRSTRPGCTTGPAHGPGWCFGYHGSPSWVLVTVDPAHRDQVARGGLVTTDHRTVPLPNLELDRNGTWGGAIPVSPYDVAAIRLLGDRPGEVLEAPLPR